MLDHLPLILAQADDADDMAPPSVPRVGAPSDGAPIETTSPDQQVPPDARPPGGSGGLFDPTFLIFIFIIVAFWFLLMGGQRKEKKRRQQMLAALQKGAKVQTVGGIIGTIMEVRENEVLLKVDENNNTRLRFSRNAIQNVLEEKE